MLSKSDYSVYEPFFDMTVNYGKSGLVSLHSFKCYTVAGWENKKPDFIVPTPVPAKRSILPAVPVAPVAAPMPIAAMLPPGAPYNPDLGLD